MSVLPASLAPVVGMSVALGAPPRRSFERYGFGSFLAGIFLSVAMYVGIFIAYKSVSMLENRPNERFVPSVIAGFGFYYSCYL
jgi:hypothetical protein